MEWRVKIRRGIAVGLAMVVFEAARAAAPLEDTQASQPNPRPEPGAKAGAAYQGAGLAVLPTQAGARLHCAFQKLEGHATPEGLWLTSTAPGAIKDHVRVVARAVGRSAELHSAVSQNCILQNVRQFETSRAFQRPAECNSAIQQSATLRYGALPVTGTVEVTGQLVRFIRPGLIEEYSVSMDGVRQDFVVESRPPDIRPAQLSTHPPLNSPSGKLRLELAVDGARAEATPRGARLVLDGSGRKIAYRRLRVTDATGRELPARMEVASGVSPDVEGRHPAARTPALRSSTRALQAPPQSAGLEAAALRQAGTPAATRLAVLVDDRDAVYPVRIDPTFSDDNWCALGAGVSGAVNALAVLNGHVYVGGNFTSAGGITVNNIAKWDGSEWSALGLGLNNPVNALVVSGADLYVGGDFLRATNSGDGPVTVNRVAKWNGSEWSALGSGVTGGSVNALVVSGTDLYAGGAFTAASGISASRVAKWNGSEWSALGSGVGSTVNALAVLGTDLYAGGTFTTAGDDSASRVAKWDGSAWSALGSGVSNTARALAVSDDDLYVGGDFATAGGISASRIAKWTSTSSSWSALGSGVNGTVRALAVTGADLYVGGTLTTAGGVADRNRIAKWSLGGTDNSSWSGLGSGFDNTVNALAVSGTSLYAGGSFTTAGGEAAANVAAADLSLALMVIADRGPYFATGTILSVTSAGVQQIISTTLKDPYDIALDAGGNYVVADYESGKGAAGGGVFRIDKNSLAQTTVSLGGSFLVPFGVKIESSGKYIVADSDAFNNEANEWGAVFRVDPALASPGNQTVISSRLVGSGEKFYWLTGVALDSGGDIYLSDQGEPGNPAVQAPRIFKVDPATGARTVIFTASGGNLLQPVGLAVESDGNSLVVADAEGGKLLRVTLPGGVLSTVSSDAQFIFPTHVAIESGGDYLVTDGKVNAGIGERKVFRVNKSTGTATLLSVDGFLEQPRGVVLIP